MEDTLGALIGLGVSTAVCGACSVYEYFRCKHLLLDDPTLSSRDLLDRHHTGEYTTFFLGVPGVELARYRHYKHRA